MPRSKYRRLSSSASNVIAAGSVINDPRSGPSEQSCDVKRRAFAHRNQPRRQRDKPFRQVDHRARGGHHHDDENKLRFREVEALDVVHRVVKRPLDRRDPEEERGRPQPEHNFGFRQEVQQVPPHRPRRVLVCPVRKPLHAERVHHGQSEQHRGEEFSGARIHTLSPSQKRAGFHH